MTGSVRKASILALSILSSLCTACPVEEPPPREARERAAFVNPGPVPLPTTEAPPSALGETPVERWLGAGECHRYIVSMAADEVLRLVIEQDGVDVATSVGVAGHPDRLELDSPVRATGLDGGTYVTSEPGRVLVELCAQASLEAAGTYRLRRDPLRRASEADRTLYDAFRAYADGRRLLEGEPPDLAQNPLEHALEGFRRAGALREQGWALSKLASLFRKQGDATTAEAAYREAAEAFEAVGDDRERMHVLNWLAYLLHWRGDYGEAASEYRDVASLAATLGASEVEGEALESAGNAHAANGETLEALARFKALIDAGDRTGQLAWVSRGHLMSGRIFLNGGDTRQALREFHAALDAAQRADLAVARARARIGIGACQLDLEQPRLALRNLEEAEELVGKDAAPRDLIELQIHLGRAFRRLGDHASAIRAFTRALELKPQALDEANLRINLARVFADAGDHQAALAQCERALPVALELDNGLHAASAFACMADNSRVLRRYDDALDAIQEAVAQVETLRSGFAQEDLRASFFSDKHRYFELYVDILLDRYRAEGDARLVAEAFEVAERSKARTLLDGLERTRSVLDAEVPPEVRARREALERQIARLEVVVLGGRLGAAPVAEASLERLNRLNRELDTVRGQILANHRGWQDALSLKPSGLETIRRELLPSGDVQIVSYFLGRERSVVWVVSQENLVVHLLPPRAELEAWASDAADLMARTHEVYLREQAGMVTARLAREILDPIAGDLFAPRLVLIKEGALNEVPFAALPWPGGGPGQQLLGDRFALVQVPSASTAISLRSVPEERARGQRLVAVVADPVFASEDWRSRLRDRAGTAARAAGSLPPRSGMADLDELLRLPASRREAEAISSLADADESLVALDFDASLDLVLSGRLQQYRWVHFATHGIVQDGISALVFSQWSRDGHRVEALLRERDVYDLKLGADLVVLSACRTGLGRRLPGEGVMGLARAFLWAGSSSVIVSLWDVDDEATAALMTRFYRELIEYHATPLVALARAQRALRQVPEWAPAHYWAGFVLEGAWD
jgi:CHAT domain-containing protein/Tfp pilus assembly protein PilF